MKLQLALHSLSHRNYKIFFSTQTVSLLGTWMQNVSLPWLAYTLTQSPLLLGLVGVLQFTPTIFLTLFTGVLLDQFDKKKVIFISQLALALISLSFAVLIFSHKIQFWHILALAGFQGIINAIEMPCRQSFLVELVGKKDLMNAIALNSMNFNMARILGPAIAGILMGQTSIGICFLLNAFSFFPLLIGLFFIEPYKVTRTNKPKQFKKDLLDGLSYVKNDKRLMQTMLAILIVSGLLFNFPVILPIFAKTVLNVGEQGFGSLFSAMGVGSLIGAMLVASNSYRPPNRLLMFLAAISGGIVFIATSFSHHFLSSLILIAFAGFCGITFHTLANSTIQLNSTDEYRSRVISVYFLVTTGSTPLGNIFTGYICEHFGVKICLQVIGVLVVVLISWLLLSDHSEKQKTVDQLN